VLNRREGNRFSQGSVGLDSGEMKVEILSMKQGSRTLPEAAPGGLDAACGKAGPAGGRGERRQLRPRGPLVSAMKEGPSRAAG
jgi:hypothetical protein